MRYKYIHNITFYCVLVFCANFTVGCLDSKSSDNNKSNSGEVSTSVNEEADGPSKSDVKEGIKWFYKKHGGLVNMDNCRGGPGSECNDKKADSVRVLKMTDKKEGVAKSTPFEKGKERTYWAVEVEIVGMCQGVMDPTEAECTSWNKFKVKGRYNIYQNDFGEWRAWYRGLQ